METDEPTIPPMTVSRLVEIRSYRLVPGSGAAFHELVSSQSMSLHERFGIEVIAHGRSAHDEDRYFLIRAFRDLDDLRQSQDRLYSSADWRTGPREEIVRLILSDADVVLPLSSAAVEVIRSSFER